MKYFPFLLPVSLASTSLWLSPSTQFNGQQLTPPQLSALLSTFISDDLHQHFALPTNSPSFVQSLNQYKVQSVFSDKSGDSGNVLLVACHALEDCVDHTSQPDVIVPDTVREVGYDALLATYMSYMATDGVKVSGMESFAKEVENAIGSEVDWEAGLNKDWRNVITEQKPKQILDIFSLAGDSARKFMEELAQLEDIYESFSLSNVKKQVKALRLSGLDELASFQGTNSEIYTTAKSTLSAILSKLIQDTNLKVVYLHIPPSSLQKRDMETSLLAPFGVRAPSAHTKREPEDVRPIVGTSKVCYTSQTACEDYTYNCNGRGACVAGSSLKTLGEGEECWVCQCAAIKDEDGKRTTYWAGEMCEKEDYSSDFMLLFGSSVALLAVVILSVQLLASVGQGELPSQLASVAGAPASKRD